MRVRERKAQHSTYTVYGIDDVRQSAGARKLVRLVRRAKIVFSHKLKQNGTNNGTTVRMKLITHTHTHRDENEERKK